MSIKKNFQQAVDEVFNLKTEPESSDKEKLVPGKNSPTKVVAVVESEVKMTFITASTKIAGSIITDSSIEIAGEIQGDIESQNTVIVTGQVHGDIKCKNIEIKGAQIEGNLTVAEKIILGVNSVIVGNLTASTIKISGKVKGNILAESAVEIMDDSSIAGDIEANSISVQNGAKIEGFIKIRTKNGKSDNLETTTTTN